MSSDLVHADPGDVRKLAHELEQFRQRVRDVSKQAQQAIDRANWHDSQKENFASRYRDFHRQTDRFVDGQVSDFVKSLRALAQDLEKAKSHRF
jgi:hypothetical protein